MISAPKHNLICKLKDTRNFGYAIAGDPRGKPVFFLGGFPGSRLDGLVIDEPARQAGLKIISLDRPGFGLSDFLPKRTFIDIAEDIRQLANELKINKFAVMGISGGGPYAAACAMAMPDTITSTTLVSSICPINTPKLLHGMKPFYRRLIKFSAYTSIGLRLAIHRHMNLAQNDSLGFFLDMLKYNPCCDQIVILNSRMHKLALATANEAYRRGVTPVLHEARLYMQDWGFDLQQVRSKVVIWHGARDEMIPIAMGAYLSNQIPATEAHFCEHDGHFLLLNRASQILKQVAGSFQN